MILLIGEALEGIFSAICEGLGESIGTLFESTGEAISGLLEGIVNVLEPICNFISGSSEDIGYAIGQNISFNTVVKHKTYPQSVLSKVHPLKKLQTKESIINWLTSNYPNHLPERLIVQFSLDKEWKIVYTPIELKTLKLFELKLIAVQLQIEPTERKNLKASWIDAIAQKEKSYLDDFLLWSDSLARSLKP